MQTYPDKYIDIMGQRLRYWDVGEGPPVLLMHGVGCMAEVWYRNIPVLAQKHRVVVLDFVGHGYSSKPKNFFEVAIIADFMQAFLHALRIDKVSLVGNSLGGGISLILAMQYPEMVDKLVLVSSAGLGRAPSLLLRIVSNLPVPLVWLPPAPRWFLRLFLNNAVYTPEVLEEELVDVFKEVYMDMETSLSLLRNLKQLIGLRGINPIFIEPILEQIEAFDKPILLTWGEQDAILPVRHGRWAEEALPDAQLHVFNPGGHMSFIEYPDEWNAMVLEFLDK